MLRERVLRTALLCCSPTPPTLYGIKTCNLGEYQPGRNAAAVSRRQVPDPLLCMRLPLFCPRTFIHHVDVFDEFIGLGVVLLVPVQPHAEVTSSVKATLTRKLDLRTGVRGENQCLPDGAARC